MISLRVLLTLSSVSKLSRRTVRSGRINLILEQI